MGRSFGGRSFGGGGRSFGGGGGFGGGHYHRRHSRGGCLYTILRIAIPLAVLGLIVLFATEWPPAVRPSTQWRQALAQGEKPGGVAATEWNDSGEEALLAGMDSFYARTGVIPHLYYIPVSHEGIDVTPPRAPSLLPQTEEEALADILEQMTAEQPVPLEWEEDLYQRRGTEVVFKNLPTEEQAEAFAQKLYDEMFEDESHMLVLYFRKSGMADYEEQVWYYCGEDAATVVDEEAGEIFLDYVGRHRFDNSRIDGGVLGRAFSDTGQRIMGPPEYVWGIVACALAAAGVCTAAILLLRWWRKKNPKQPPPPGEL